MDDWQPARLCQPCYLALIKEVTRCSALLVKFNKREALLETAQQQILPEVAKHHALAEIAKQEALAEQQTSVETSRISANYC